MADAPRALAQARAVLEPGGTFILEFANKRNLKAIARWLLRRQSWSPFDLGPVEFAALNFDFHPRSMLGWLRAAGLEPRQVRAVSHFRLGLLKRWAPARLLAALDAVLQPTGRLFQLTPSVFVRAQAVGEGAAAAPGQLFRCPACGSADLSEAGDALHCANCARRWAIRDGIYDFKEPVG
jgi:hypothetical protein